MYKNEYGLIVYESLEELINQGISQAYEDDDYLYIRLKNLQDEYDGRAWTVNKITGKVASIGFIADLCTRLSDGTIRPIDISQLKKRVT